MTLPVSPALERSEVESWYSKALTVVSRAAEEAEAVLLPFLPVVACPTFFAPLLANLFADSLRGFVDELWEVLLLLLLTSGGSSFSRSKVMASASCLESTWPRPYRPARAGVRV